MLRRVVPSLSAVKPQIAIIGSGPSACYLADHLIKKHDNVHVDLYERLPVPFGLVRYGVAPDHPEVKSVEKKFTQVLEDDRVTWLGNIKVGRDITVPQLQAAYSAVVVATGGDADRPLSCVPGTDLGNVYSARQFVNYYNTLPLPLSNPLMFPFDLSQTRNALIIGNGNVSLDVARVLACSYKHWCPTDMNCRSVDALMQNRIRRVSIVGRRGHEHAAFTTAEFREITKLSKNIHVQMDPFDLDETLKRSDGSRARKRMLELMHKFAPTTPATPPDTSTPPPLPSDRGDCDVKFLFNMKPLRILPREDRKNHVGGVVFERTNIATGEKAVVGVPADVVFTSIGSRSEPIQGIPFDEAQGLVPNIKGRVATQPEEANKKENDAATIPGLYATGWVKRGPRGVILFAMMDAHETAECVLTDLESGRAPPPTNERRGKYSLLDLMITKNLYPVSFKAFKRILSTETNKGLELGKRLEKVSDIKLMMDIAMGGKVGMKADLHFRGIQPPRPDAAAYLDEFLDDETDLSKLVSNRSAFSKAALEAVEEATETRLKGEENNPMPTTPLS